MSALEQDFVTVTEAASLLRVSPATVRRWIRAGVVPAYHLGPRRVALRRSDLSGLITPIRPGVEVIANNSHGEIESARRKDMEHSSESQRPVLPVPKLTPEERRGALAALARLEKLSCEIATRQGSQSHPSTLDIIDQMRAERMRQLIGE